MLFSARWLNSVDLTTSATMNLGISALFGPNATGENIKTDVYGIDLYLKWQPLSTAFDSIIGQVEDKPGIPPSPARLKEVMGIIKEQKVKLLLMTTYAVMLFSLGSVIFPLSYLPQKTKDTP